MEKNEQIRPEDIKEISALVEELTVSEAAQVKAVIVGMRLSREAASTAEPRE